MHTLWKDIVSVWAVVAPAVLGVSLVNLAPQYFDECNCLEWNHTLASPLHTSLTVSLEYCWKECLEDSRCFVFNYNVRKTSPKLSLTSNCVLLMGPCRAWLKLATCSKGAKSASTDTRWCTASVSSTTRRASTHAPGGSSSRSPKTGGPPAARISNKLSLPVSPSQ